METEHTAGGRAAAAQPQPLPGRASKPFDVFRFLFLRAVYIALFGTVLFLPGLPLVVAKKYAVYQVSGRIQFEREPLSAMGAAPSQSIAYYFQDYVRSQTKLIKEQFFLRDVLEALPAGEWPQALLPHAGDPMRAAARLSGLLEVNFDNGTQFIALKMESLATNGVAETLNAVMARFVENKVREQFDTTERNMAYVNAQCLALDADVEREQQAADAAARQAGTSAFVEDGNVWRSAYQQTQGEYAKAQVARIDKGWRLAAESNRVAAVRALSIQSLADELTAADQSLWGVTQYTYQELQDLRKSVDGVAPGNPDRRYTDERMKALDDFAKSFRKEVEQRNLRILLDKREYDTTTALLAALAEDAAARAAERDLQALAEDVKSRMTETSSALWTGRRAEQRLERLRAQHDVFENRLRVLEAERNAAPRASVAVSAVPPVAGEVKFPKKLLMVLLVLSYGMVAGLYGAFDLLDNRVRTAKDVQAALGAEIVKPVWHVPPPVRYFGILGTHPAHPVSSALRALAYRLEREHRVNATQVFLFTGVSRQAGVTDTLLNVSVALRRMSLNVAVLELNVSAPACAKRYGLAEGAYTPVNRHLWEGAALEACRVEGRAGLPDLYAAEAAAGDQPVAGRALFALVDRLRERYDLVLVDAEPITQSEFAVFLAQRAQAAVLLVREDASLYRDLRLAMRLAANAGVGSVTAVLNFDVARNPVGSLFGQIQKMIGLASLSVRLFGEQRRAFRENYTTVCERRLFMPLVRWHVLEYCTRWTKEAERVIRA